MPRTRISTSEGYLEIQWDKPGTLVCIVSGKAVLKTKQGRSAVFETHMHQFTQDDLADLNTFDQVTHRATKRLESNPGLCRLMVELQDFMDLPPDSRKLLIGIPKEEDVSHISHDTWLELFKECVNAINSSERV